MHPPSSVLTATLQALRGEPNVHVVAPALGDPQFARVLALAPDVDSIVGALGALAGALLDFLAPVERDTSDLSDAVASLIGTDTRDYVLELWADVAPAGWGVAHATALINAVERNRCARWAAAALIGPTNDAAALLHAPWGIAAAIRRWGQATPDHPTAWMDTLEPAQRDRLMETLRAEPPIAVTCLPWLPEANAANVVAHIERTYHAAVLSLALDAYAAASSIARTAHATILFPLMQRAEPGDLAKLTRLAVATGMDAAWATVVRLLRDDPWSAIAVITETPWNNLDAKVQTTILSAAPHNDVCAAIAFARGVRERPPPTTGTTARAFFAAVTREVWTALPAETQRAWRDALHMSDASLAVRSLGPDPTFLAHTHLNDGLTAAVRSHVADAHAARGALLSVAVRDLPITALPAVIAALPPPSDPVAFVQIAGRRREMPPALRDWITAHPTPRSCSTAMTLLHIAEQRGIPIDRCAALAQALADWSREETDALLAALPDDTHAALHPNADALTAALSHPDRRDAFRQALDALDALPSSAALPARHALDALAQTKTPSDQRHAGEILAQALRNHGRIFTDIAGALRHDKRAALLPHWDDPYVGSSLETLAVADPLVAHHMAHALHANDPATARDALATAPLDKMPGIWRLLPDTIRSAIPGDRDALLCDVAAPGRADALAQTLQAWNADDPLALLALRMLIENDDARRARGAAILAQQPDMAASLLPLLREDLRAVLVRDPRIAVAGADLPPLSSPAPAPMLPPRRRRSR
jgi:hypothetical protein